MDNANQTRSNEIKSSKQKCLEMRFIWRVGIISRFEKSPQTLDFLILDALRGNDLATEFHYS